MKLYVGGWRGGGGGAVCHLSGWAARRRVRGRVRRQTVSMGSNQGDGYLLHNHKSSQSNFSTNYPSWIKIRQITFFYCI